MRHKISYEDQVFLTSFARCHLGTDRFRHREHLRLAYILLAKYTVDEAYEIMRGCLLRFLKHVGAEPSKYHATMTYAWLLAVKHFMHTSSPSQSSNEFIRSNEILLDKNIMSSHYSCEVIESEQARARYIAPDLEPIPLYEAKIA